MSVPHQSDGRCFNENSPRPPVPGEETEGQNCRLVRSESPALTPRRSSLANPKGSGSYHDSAAPLGFEPEGRSSDIITMEGDSPPTCLQWAKNLHSLLQDSKGAELFKQYLIEEGWKQANPLDFWFVCEGLKVYKDPEEIQKVVGSIKKKFLRNQNLKISETTRREAIRRIEEDWRDIKALDAVQVEVEQFMSETIYPNFLQSERYIKYVKSCQNAESLLSSASSSSSSTGDGCPSSGLGSRELSVSCGASLLPTVQEDSEYVSSHVAAPTLYSHPASDTPAESKSELRLTKDMLMATQLTRAKHDLPKFEAFPGIHGYIQQGISPYRLSKIHTQYCPYNAVSRQDSELQSLSSDARTETDSMSMADFPMDGTSSSGERRRKKQHSVRPHKSFKDIMNRDPLSHHTFIPRTQRVSREQTAPVDVEKFAEVLKRKLELVQKERDLDNKLKATLDCDLGDAPGDASGFSAGGGGLARSLPDAIRYKMMIDDDNDQAILDQHVSRVWSDLTPSRTPGGASPRPHSPDKKRSTQHYSSRTYKDMRKKDKDGFSTFSVDSGNIHDFPESDFPMASSMSSLSSYLPKSKSVPSDYADSLHKQDLYSQGHDPRFRRSDMTRRSATKKSMTELTDSGVSVVSDATSINVNKDRLVARFKESDVKKLELRHSRHGKKYGSRSGSLERATRENLCMSNQPMVGMSGLPSIQPAHLSLVEAVQRLEEDKRSEARGNSRKYPAQSNQSTLRKAKSDDFTVVVFNFCDEQFPYRTRIPGHNVTLKQFKEYLPKKGSYRYFFKTECEDLDVKVIQEEITDDSDILPLWEGKVMAQVKTME